MSDDVEVWVGTEPDQVPGPGGGMTLLSGPWFESVQRLADEQDAAAERMAALGDQGDRWDGIVRFRTGRTLGARPNLVITDELLGRGPAQFELDPNGEDWARARAEVLHRHLDRELLDQVAPPPADVEAALAAWREFVTSVTVAYEQIGQSLLPQLVDLREAIADAAALVLGPHPEDEPEPEGVAERALWLKQRPGRTGPPARRMDGRRSR